MREDLKELSALTALNNMMQGGHFNICCVDSVGKLLGVKPDDHESYAILRPLHCVDFAKMPQPLRDAIPSLVQDCLGVSPTYQFKSIKPGDVIEVSVPQQRGALLRLFGGKS